MEHTQTIDADPLTQCLRAWQAGSRRAGDRLFRRLGQRLHGYVTALSTELGSLDGDDLLQDVFLTFLTQADSFDTSGGDGALVRWFQVTLRRRWWALSARASRTVAVGDAALVAEGTIEPVVQAAEARVLAHGRLRSARAAVQGAGEVRFQRRSQERLLRALDQVEAVVLGDRQASASSGELARSVGWSAFQMWQMTARMQQAVGASPAQVRPSSEPEARKSGASVPIVESATTQPEAVTPGCKGESREIAFGTDAQFTTVRAAATRRAPSRGRRSLARARPSPIHGTASGAPPRVARLTRGRPPIVKVICRTG